MLSSDKMKKCRIPALPMLINDCRQMTTSCPLHSQIEPENIKSPVVRACNMGNEHTVSPPAQDLGQLWIKVEFQHDANGKIKGDTLQLLGLSLQNNVTASLPNDPRLKDLAAQFVLRMGELSITTSDHNGKLANDSGKIRKMGNTARPNKVPNDVLLSMMQRTYSEITRLRRAMRNDDLTGALNRRGLEKSFQREAARAERQNSSLCLAVIDIDNFKQINDTHGHLIGDEVLIHLVTVVNKALRPQDAMARLGGDEFAILLPDTRLEEAVNILSRLQHELTRQRFLHGKTDVLITFSAGVAMRQGAESQGTQTGRADAALYQAKTLGKNRVIPAT